MNWVPSRFRKTSLLQGLKKSFDEESLREEIERLLGTAWELALEPFRRCRI